MSGVTYLLDDKYYSICNEVSKTTLSIIDSKCNDYLDEFLSFIEREKIEKVRTREEYSIEILLIGVILKEYGGYTKNLAIYGPLFKSLNILRKNPKYKSKVDKIKGRLMTLLLLDKKEEKNYVTLKNFKRILLWMDMTGDFKEELFRLKNWIRFLRKKSSTYYKKFIKDILYVIEVFYKEGKDKLGNYLLNLPKFLEEYLYKYKNREDIIYCGKGEIQYYFNMVSAEIMNNVYREKFLKLKKRKIFVPVCMIQKERQCRRIENNNGDICIGCTKRCNVNVTNIFSRERGAKLIVIPHESNLFYGNNNCNKEVGIVGVACLVNLISGGWKALRLGFIPQCVVLEYCGCNHWLKKEEMTVINYNRLEEILK